MTSSRRATPPLRARGVGRETRRRWPRAASSRATTPRTSPRNRRDSSPYRARRNSRRPRRPRPRLRVDSAPVSGLGHIERLIHGHDVFAIHPPLEPPVLTPSCLVSPSFATQARGVTARKASALSARSAVASAPVSAVVGASPRVSRRPLGGGCEPPRKQRRLSQGSG